MLYLIILRVQEDKQNFVFVVEKRKYANIKDVERAHKVVLIFTRRMVVETDVFYGASQSLVVNAMILVISLL